MVARLALMCGHLTATAGQTNSGRSRQQWSCDIFNYDIMAKNFQIKSLQKVNHSEMLSTKDCYGGANQQWNTQGLLLWGHNVLKYDTS